IDPNMIADELGPSISITNITTGQDGMRHVILNATDPSGLLSNTGIGTPPFLVSLQNDGDLIDNMATYIIGSEVVVPPGSLLTACAVDGAGNRACEVFTIP